MQESLDQLNKSKTDEGQIDTLKVEISRIKNLEPMFEKLKVISPLLSLNAHSGVTKYIFCVFNFAQNPSHFTSLSVPRFLFMHFYFHFICVCEQKIYAFIST